MIGPPKSEQLSIHGPQVFRDSHRERSKGDQKGRSLKFKLAESPAQHFANPQRGSEANLARLTKVREIEDGRYHCGAPPILKIQMVTTESAPVSH